MGDSRPADGGQPLPTEQPTASDTQASTCCSVCSAEGAKYKCPGCQARTCSMACVDGHKKATGCSGRRDRLAFIKLKEFDDKALMSDYNFLEEVKRIEDTAARVKPPAPQKQLPPRLGKLVQQAARRNTRLLIMAPGMHKRRTNTTGYDFATRKLHWRLEWRFPGAGGRVVADPRVAEDTCPLQLLEGHLEARPGQGEQGVALREYAAAGAGALRVFMVQEKSPANDKRYYPVDLSLPLKDTLANRLVIEHPTFIVALPSEASDYPPPDPTPPPSATATPPSSTPTPSSAAPVPPAASMHTRIHPRTAGSRPPPGPAGAPPPKRPCPTPPAASSAPAAGPPAAAPRPPAYPTPPTPQLAAPRTHPTTAPRPPIHSAPPPHIPGPRPPSGPPPAAAPPLHQPPSHRPLPPGPRPPPGPPPSSAPAPSAPPTHAPLPQSGYPPQYPPQIAPRPAVPPPCPPSYPYPAQPPAAHPPSHPPPQAQHASTTPYPSHPPPQPYQAPAYPSHPPPQAPQAHPNPPHCNAPSHPVPTPTSYPQHPAAPSTHQTYPPTSATYPPTQAPYPAYPPAATDLQSIAMDAIGGSAASQQLLLSKLAAIEAVMHSGPGGPPAQPHQSAHAAPPPHLPGMAPPPHGPPMMGPPGMAAMGGPGMPPPPHQQQPQAYSGVMLDAIGL